MNTARFFGAAWVAMLCASVAAVLWHPAGKNDGRIPLLWVSDNNPARTEQIATFNRENTRYDLALDYANKDVQKIVMQCSSGVGPDLFDMSGDQMQSYVEAGVLWDLSPATRDNSLYKISPAGSRSVTYFGKQYGYPCNVGVNILIYNKNIFDRAGLPYPQGVLSWDEFIVLCQKLKAANLPGVVPVTGLSWKVFLESAHGEFFGEDERPHLTDSETWETAFALHKKMLEQGLMLSVLEAKALSGQGGWGNGDLNQFAAGKFAMMINGEWTLIGLERTYQQQMRDAQAQAKAGGSAGNPDDKPLRLGCMLIPRFADRTPCYRLLGRSVGINAKSPRRTEALAFVRYLSGASYAKLLNRDADWLPGNPDYVDAGVSETSGDLGRLAMHEATKEAVGYGYVPRASRLLLTSDVVRVLTEQTSRLESDPQLEVKSLLATAQSQLEVLLARNRSQKPN